MYNGNIRSITHKSLNRTLFGQNETECKFSRESSSSSHKHYKTKQISYLLPIGFFQLSRMCARDIEFLEITRTHTHTKFLPPHTHRACTLATPGQESFQVRYDDSSLKSGNQETRAGSLVNAMLNEGQNRIQTLWARQVFRVAHWQIFWPMTSNKRLPSRMVWTSSGCMGDISVQIVWRESVKQLSTTPLNSFNRDETWPCPCIEKTLCIPDQSQHT